MTPTMKARADYVNTRWQERLTKEREWMGVEPTRAGSAPPHTGFEDRGAHRDSTTPRSIIHVMPPRVKQANRLSLVLFPKELLPGSRHTIGGDPVEDP